MFLSPAIALAVALLRRLKKAVVVVALVASAVVPGGLVVVVMAVPVNSVVAPCSIRSNALPSP
jgi:hypothetical protein